MDEEMQTAGPAPKFDDMCFGPRQDLKVIGERVKALMNDPVFTSGQNLDFGEMKANIMLSYRHIEDARMRLGKAVQAFDGGTSCYPR